MAVGDLDIDSRSDHVAKDTITNVEAETCMKTDYDVFDSNEVPKAHLPSGST